MIASFQMTQKRQRYCCGTFVFFRNHFGKYFYDIIVFLKKKSLNQEFFLLFIAFIVYFSFWSSLSDSIINGLSVGCVYHVIVSQINGMLGLKLSPLNIPLIIIGVNILFKQRVTHFNRNFYNFIRIQIFLFWASHSLYLIIF